MKTLIVGCGYLGSALIPTLQSISTCIAATTRKKARILELSKLVSTAHLIHSPSDIEDLIQEYDLIIFSVGAESKDSYESAYLLNAQAIASGLQRSDKNQQVIYTGSTSVYGDHNGEWVDETSDLKAKSPQAKILIAAEKTLLKAASPSKFVCIFRLGGIIGPGRTVEDRVKQNSGKELPSDGMSFTNLSPVELIADGVQLAIKQKLDGVYNLCSSEHVLRKELYDSVADHHGIPRVKWNPAEDFIYGGNKKVFSDKFKHALGSKSGF